MMALDGSVMGRDGARRGGLAKRIWLTVSMAMSLTPIVIPSPGPVIPSKDGGKSYISGLRHFRFAKMMAPEEEACKEDMAGGHGDGGKGQRWV